MPKKKASEIREFPRVFPVREMRAEERSDGVRIISGYAAVFDSETVIGNWFREVIRAGAFTKTISEADQVALWNHDDGKPLGRKSEKTLRLSEDSKGLRFEIDIDDRSWALDTWKSVKRGDVKGASFRFRVVKEAWTEPQSDNSQELPLRELMELKLYEVSPVTFPSYEATEVDARAVLQSAEQRGLIHTAGEATTEKPEADHSEERTEPGKPNHFEAGANRQRELQVRENEFKQRRMEIGRCLHS